jgi:hypothetical protein
MEADIARTLEYFCTTLPCARASTQLWHGFRTHCREVEALREQCLQSMRCLRGAVGDQSAVLLVASDALLPWLRWLTARSIRLPQYKLDPLRANLARLNDRLRDHALPRRLRLP